MCGRGFAFIHKDTGIPCSRDRSCPGVNILDNEMAPRRLLQRASHPAASIVSPQPVLFARSCTRPLLSTLTLPPLSLSLPVHPRQCHNFPESTARREDRRSRTLATPLSYISRRLHEKHPQRSKSAYSNQSKTSNK